MKRLDYIMNGSGFGAVAERLVESGGDVGALRPWYSPRKRRSYVTLNVGRDRRGKPVYKNFVVNAPATLTKDAWLRLDRAILRTARAQLRVWGDLVGAGLTYNIPNGMGTTVIQHGTMSDNFEATLSMDGLRESMRDRPTTDLVNLPLPIAHGDFSFSLREIMVSRNGGMPLDTTGAEMVTRRVSELVEKLTLGTLSSYSYGGGTVYGLTNFPNRLTKTITLPTSAGWTPETTYSEVLDMIQSASDIFFNGPFVLYYSPGWGKYINADYSSAYPGATLRTKLGQVDDIVAVRKVDYLSNYQLVLVQMASEVIQAVQGMGMTTLQWESHGGLQKNFKVMAIMVPRLRADPSGNTGIVHATAA